MAINLTDPTYNDEDTARAYFEAIRWPDGVVCCHCGNTDSARIYAIKANPAKKVRAGLYECQECHGQFTVRTGGVMESSHVPLTKWALAYRFMASSKKGMSAHQLHRSIGVTYKTAWFMWHRIREAMREDVMPPMDSRPYCAWMRLNSLAAWPMASSQLTSRHGSVNLARIMGLVMRSLCVA